MIVDGTRVWGLVMLSMLMAGCPQEEAELVVTAEFPDAVDECTTSCLHITAVAGLLPVDGAGVQVGVDDGPLSPAGELDSAGELDHCPYQLEPGDHKFTVSVNKGQTSAATTVAFTVYPFGYELGLLKNGVLPDPLPMPVVDYDEGNPVFGIGDEGAWDSSSVMMPGVVPFDDGYLMLYGGRDLSSENYQIGAAFSDDGLSWARLADEPVIPAGAVGEWGSLSAGGPSLLELDGELRVWFHAHGEEGTRIAAARSTDGRNWTMDTPEPVLDVGPIGSWDEQAVAHPSVKKRGDVYEMWYASAELQVGHAISTDGVEWVRYCGNPVFEPIGGDSWEGGQSKAPEVIYDEGLYHLFYSGGGQEAWRVGHAVSADGLRWSRTGGSPLLPAGDPGDWDESGTINATPLPYYGAMRLWYTGVSTGPSAVGVATIEEWN